MVFLQFNTTIDISSHISIVISCTAQWPSSCQYLYTSLNDNIFQSKLHLSMELFCMTRCSSPWQYLAWNDSAVLLWKMLQSMVISCMKDAPVKSNILHVDTPVHDNILHERCSSPWWYLANKMFQSMVISCMQEAPVKINILHKRCSSSW